jgi:hypothetical protein
VCVAKDRNAIGRQFEYLLDSTVEAALGLVGQSVHQVDIDRTDAAITKEVNRLAGNLVTLFPSDCLLDDRIEILNTDRD